MTNKPISLPEKSISQNEIEEWNNKIKNGQALAEVKKVVLSMARINKVSCDPELTLKRIAEEIIPKVKFQDKPLSGKDLEIINQAIIDMGIENDFSIIESAEPRYRGMIINLRRNLIKEFQCVTYSEKVLVDLAAGAYARNLSLSSQLSHIANRKEITALTNSYISILSKEIDRANRQFITAIETLKQFRQPGLKVNIKTNNAFISQSQQFNNFDKNNLGNNLNQNNEIIDAK